MVPEGTIEPEERPQPGERPPPGTHPQPGEHLHVDVLIIGAGVAGLVTALDVLEIAPHLDVAILDKSRPRTTSGTQEGGSTPLAQGGLAAAMGPGDSPELHVSDTIRAGDGLCDPRAVAVVTTEGPLRVADLIRRGTRFDREPTQDAALALAREAGQSVARSVRASDATGAEIARALRATATGRVQRMQGIATELATAGTEQAVIGAYAMLDTTEASAIGAAQSGGMTLITAGATVLATGGCGGLYASTTNPDGATADGVALAYATGAALSDMEFIQFHPTGLKPQHVTGYQRFLLTEALRGAGATLINSAGERFMLDRHPDTELAPRYVVTKAILDQAGAVWLDATGLSEEQLTHEFPTMREAAKQAGFDLGADPVPVEPCQHYMIGGVATDLRARTTVPGLWATGEVACSGVHGANRMAGNSLLQACVFGHRAAGDIVASLATTEAPATRHIAPSGARETHVDITGIRDSLRQTMSDGAGPVRQQDGLQATLKDLVSLRNEIGPGPFVTRELIELDNALTVATLITEAALARTESRGVHWREDFPSHKPLWEGRHLRHTRIP